MVEFKTGFTEVNFTLQKSIYSWKGANIKYLLRFCILDVFLRGANNLMRYLDVDRDSFLMRWNHPWRTFVTMMNHFNDEPLVIFIQTKSFFLAFQIPA